MQINMAAPGPLLFLIFMVLKLCGVITWSWWIVTMPLWLPLLIAGIFVTIFAYLARPNNSRRGGR